MTITVYGIPAPKGSSRAMLMKGRAINVPSGSNVNRDMLAAWRGAVRDALYQALGPRTSPFFVDEPLRVMIAFRLPRPGGHWGKRGLKPKAPPCPYRKPDIDKLARATLDAMTGIVYDDDARIVSKLTEKFYAAPGQEGATITIERFTRGGHDVAGREEKPDRDAEGRAPAHARARP